MDSSYLQISNFCQWPYPNLIGTQAKIQGAMSNKSQNCVICAEMSVQLTIADTWRKEWLRWNSGVMTVLRRGMRVWPQALALSVRVTSKVLLIGSGWRGLISLWNVIIVGLLKEGNWGKSWRLGSYMRTLLLLRNLKSGVDRLDSRNSLVTLRRISLN